MSQPESQFIYLLNAMEGAAQYENPFERGYADKRRAVLEYVAKLETVAPSAVERRMLCSCVTMQYPKCKLCDENGYIVVPSASTTINDAEIEKLRTEVKGAVSNLWAEASARQIVHDKVDAVFAAAARYQVLRAHFWKPILGACFGRYMIAEEKDERLLDYHVDRATKNAVGPTATEKP